MTIQRSWSFKLSKCQRNSARRTSDLNCIGPRFNTHLGNIFVAGIFSHGKTYNANNFVIIADLDYFLKIPFTHTHYVDLCLLTGSSATPTSLCTGLFSEKMNVEYLHKMSDEMSDKMTKSQIRIVRIIHIISNRFLCEGYNFGNNHWWL